MTAIINATLVMRDHLIPNGVLLMDNGKITAVSGGKCIVAASYNGKEYTCIVRVS